MIEKSDWDAFDCVREETGSSVTIYHIPDGTLHSFSLDGVVYQVHSDALGSVRMITDASGAVVARLEYGAWGEEIFVSAIPALANFPYRFVGALGVRTDPETGLVWMRERHFDPQLQRFISRDPIGLSGGANLYAYAGGNPVRFVDPSGEVLGLPTIPPLTVPVPTTPVILDTIEFGASQVAQQAARAGVGAILAEAAPVVAGILIAAALVWLLHQIAKGAAAGSSGGGAGDGFEPWQPPKVDPTPKPKPQPPQPPRPPAPPDGPGQPRRRRVCKLEWQALVNVKDNCYTGKRGLQRLCHYKCLPPAGGFWNLFLPAEKKCDDWHID